nr:GDP-Man:Man(3)GlcNAc(2)-PP-Dol alpha-1,2-mannosyltransferase-like [Ciona intestinalis]|eukprot:XP_002129496.1 GDP-Man:Man(3)GlcNAc(2)-PP-Dol alpha-1,2-mannosyltransferase-like [Ciona intestinalis]
MICVLTTGIAVTFCIILPCLACLKILVLNRKWRRGSQKVIGFFHPYCNAGGGGERVLWCAVRAIQESHPGVKCVVYTGDITSTASQILNKASSTFGITLSNSVDFVFLRRRRWVEATRYPILTLLGQSMGSVWLGVEALLACPPDVFLDTMGYAFTLPLFKYIGGCRTGCYVHYPTISTDMLNVVECQNDSFNNRKLIARSKLLTKCKLIYYRAFAFMYGVAGRCSEAVLTNSSWTLNHINQIWKCQQITSIVFPPCDISGFLEIPLTRKPTQDILGEKYEGKLIVLSIAQFRPEKNHSLQVESFHKFLSICEDPSKHLLLMVGGCRNEGDESRVAELKSLISKLNLQEKVEIRTNISFGELKDLLSVAHVGIHTMSNEHFGIGVVEFQAAGVIALANNSGGPKMDIVKEIQGCQTGFLAHDVTTYSEALRDIYSLTVEKRTEILGSARAACKRFSEQEFKQHFLAAISPVLVSRPKTE